jgi:hypothetical protein
MELTLKVQIFIGLLLRVIPDGNYTTKDEE